MGFNDTNAIQENKRIEYLDIAKGIGIIMMIMGHIGFTETFSHYIHAINMPLFFVISGYLYKEVEKSQLKVFIIKKVKRLLIPYLFFGILNILIASFAIRDFNIVNSLGHLFWINNTGLALSGAIWFLTSLFWAEIFFTIISLVNHKIIKNMLIIVTVLVGLILPVRLPFSMNVSLVAVGFLFIGYHFKNIEVKIDEWFSPARNKIWFCLLILLNFVMIYLNGFVNLRKHSYSNVVLFYINAVIGAFIILYCSKLILEFKFSVTDIANKLLILIGIDSLVYMALNELFLKLINYYYIYNGENIVFKLLYKGVLLFAIILFTHFVTMTVSKTKCKVFIGK